MPGTNIVKRAQNLDKEKKRLPPGTPLSAREVQEKATSNPSSWPMCPENNVFPLSLNFPTWKL